MPTRFHPLRVGTCAEHAVEPSQPSDKADTGFVLACRVRDAHHRRIRAEVLKERCITFSVAQDVPGNAHYNQKRRHISRSKPIGGDNSEILSRVSQQQRALESRHKERNGLVRRLGSKDPLRHQRIIPDITSPVQVPSCRTTLSGPDLLGEAGCGSCMLNNTCALDSLFTLDGNVKNREHSQTSSRTGASCRRLRAPKTPELGAR
jgi:hypothetical protein